MRKIIAVLIFFVALLFFGPAMAADGGKSGAAAEQEEIARIKARLKKVIPNREPTSVKKSVVPGVFEVLYDLRQYYITADGRYLIPDGIIDLEKDGEKLAKTNLNKAIASSVEAVGDDNMVTFGDKKKSKYTVTVFTDIDCGYCRKLHSEIDDYNDEGIRIRYLFYPRAGVASPSYTKAVSVWCANNRNQAMTKAKKGGNVREKKCDNPVKSHMLLGERIGLQGTPAIVLADGEVLPGYVPAKQLAAYLEKKQKSK